MAERDPMRPRGCTCHRLRRTTRQMTRIYDARLVPVGLTLTQYSVLSTLVRGETPTPGVNEMAEILGMDRTTLTRTLKPLIAARLVTLATGDDRRSKKVSVTEAGRALWEKAKPLWRAAQDEIEARLGSSEVYHLHKLLDTTFEVLGTPAA
jgi:DNA-binding MarR family transcriptional regulator